MSLPKLAALSVALGFLAAPAFADVVYTTPLFASGDNSDNFGFGSGAYIDRAVPEFSGPRGRVRGATFTIDLVHTGTSSGTNNDEVPYSFETSSCSSGGDEGSTGEEGCSRVSVDGFGFSETLRSVGDPDAAITLEPGVPTTASGSFRHVLSFELDADDPGFDDVLEGTSFQIRVFDAAWWDREGQDISDFSYTWTFEGTFSVAYELRGNAVPEPGVLGLLGLGLVGLGWRRSLAQRLLK